MATIKHYTTIEQSKKLLELGLNPKTADMCYILISIDDYGTGTYKPALLEESFKENLTSIPCWSLAALLKTLNFPSLTQNKGDEWEVCVFDHDNDDYIEKTASNPVDACYEMILKLNELNLL